MTRYRWMLAQKAEGVSTSMCCGMAQVSRQAFYEWQARHARRRSCPIWPDEGSLPAPRTGRGCRTSPTCAPARAGCISLWCST